MTLDKKDFQIIYQLDQDCRRSLTQIAKKVRLHRNVVEYRIKKMETDGVIRGYYTQINTMALGYITFRIFINISNANSEQEKALITFLKKDMHTIWFFRVQGKWDFDVLLVAKNLFEVDKFLEEFQIKFNHLIEDKNVALFSKIYDLPKDYLIGKKEREFGKNIFKPLGRISLNVDEINILKALSNDARIKIIDLAKKTKLSINTTKKIIKDLVKKQAIFGFRPFIDTAKSGYQYHKIHINLRRYTASDFTKIKSWLEINPNIISINNLINGDDLEVEIHLSSEQELNEFILMLKKEFGQIIKDSFVIQFTEEFVFRYLPEDINIE